MSEEVAEIGQALGRTGAALLSAALVAARIAMQRRAEQAEQARRANERRQQEIARQLHADRETAAVQWQRVNLRAWFRESPNEVAEVWASAATWAEQDPRAREAFESLNLHLDRLGGHDPEVAQAMREARDYGGLAQLLKRGADEAYGRLTGQSPATEQHSATEASADQVAAWERLNPTLDHAGEDVAQAWAWRQFDPDAAESFESVKPHRERLGVEVPQDVAVPDAAQAEGLAELLERGATHTPETGTQIDTQVDWPADWQEFADWYRDDPSAALGALATDYLTPISINDPESFAALQQAAAADGAPHLAEWFAENPRKAFAVYQPAQPDTTVPEGNRAAPSAVEQRGDAQPPQPATIYDKASSAVARLAGKGFARPTAEATRRGAKHRKTRGSASSYRPVAWRREERHEVGRG